MKPLFPQRRTRARNREIAAVLLKGKAFGLPLIFRYCLSRCGSAPLQAGWQKPTFRTPSFPKNRPFNVNLSNASVNF
jgi:hypothetical protein